MIESRRPRDRRAPDAARPVPPPRSMGKALNHTSRQARVGRERDRWLAYPDADRGVQLVEGIGEPMQVGRMSMSRVSCSAS